MEQERQYISLSLDKAMLDRIDDFRYDNRFPSRTEAIRHLIQTALSSARKPTKKSA